MADGQGVRLEPALQLIFGRMHVFTRPTVALRAAEAGIGVTVMPCYRGDAQPRLVRVGPTMDHLDMELWIMTHPVLRHTARVRVLMTFLTDAFAAKAELFAGLTPRPQ